MPTVHIPPLMRDLTGGQGKAVVQGATIRQVINDLDATFPGLKARLVDGDRINPAIAVAVDGEVIRLGLLQRVKEDSEIHFLPAIGGGAVALP